MQFCPAFESQFQESSIRVERYFFEQNGHRPPGPKVPVCLWPAGIGGCTICIKSENNHSFAAICLKALKLGRPIEDDDLNAFLV